MSFKLTPPAPLPKKPKPTLREISARELDIPNIVPPIQMSELIASEPKKDSLTQCLEVVQETINQANEWRGGKEPAGFSGKNPLIGLFFEGDDHSLIEGFKEQEKALEQAIHARDLGEVKRVVVTYLEAYKRVCLAFWGLDQ